MLTLIAFALVLTTPPAPAQCSPVLVLSWAPPPAPTATAAKALHSMGIDVAGWPAGAIDALKGTGLRALVYPATPADAARLRERPEVWGYFVDDEPFPESTFAKVAANMRAMEQEAAPSQVAYVNVLSTTGPFLRRYLDVVQPSWLSFDYYQWFWGTARFYEKLEDMRAAARERRIPWMSFVETSANPRSETGDFTIIDGNAARLRLSSFSALAYGADALHYADSTRLVDKSGKPTALSRDVAAIAREVRALAPVLACLRSVDVFHTEPAPSGTRSFPRESWVQADAEPGSAGLLVGLFVDERDGADYVFVVNREIARAQQATIRFQSRWLGLPPWHQPEHFSFTFEKVDKRTGKLTALTTNANNAFVDVVGAGDGELYRVTTKTGP